MFVCMCDGGLLDCTDIKDLKVYIFHMVDVSVISKSENVP